MSTAAIIVAGGSANRYGGDLPKQYLEVAGRPLLAWTLSRFEQAGSIDNVVLVVGEEYLVLVSEQVIDPYDFHKVTKIVSGGSSRIESVRKGLEALPASTEIVAIHDGARPSVSPDDIDRVVAAAIESRAAMLAIPATDTVKRVKDGLIQATLDRETLWLAQTPQVFEYDLILAAHRNLDGNDSDLERITDDASLFETVNNTVGVRVIQPESPNLKITTPDDLRLFEQYLKAELND